MCTRCCAVIEFKVYWLTTSISQGQDLRWYRFNIVQTYVMISILRMLGAVNLIFSFISMYDVISGLCDFEWI